MSESYESEVIGQIERGRGPSRLQTIPIAGDARGVCSGAECSSICSSRILKGLVLILFVSLNVTIGALIGARYAILSDSVIDVEGEYEPTYFTTTDEQAESIKNMTNGTGVRGHSKEMKEYMDELIHQTGGAYQDEMTLHSGDRALASQTSSTDAGLILDSDNADVERGPLTSSSDLRRLFTVHTYEAKVVLYYDHADNPVYSATQVVKIRKCNMYGQSCSTWSANIAYSPTPPFGSTEVWKVEVKSSLSQCHLFRNGQKWSSGSNAAGLTYTDSHANPS